MSKRDTLPAPYAPIEDCPKEPGTPYVLLVSGPDYDGLVPILAEWNVEIFQNEPGWSQWYDGELCGNGLRCGTVVKGYLPTGRGH
jgi:hypothetical protein